MRLVGTCLAGCKAAEGQADGERGPGAHGVGEAGGPPPVQVGAGQLLVRPCTVAKAGGLGTSWSAWSSKQPQPLSCCRRGWPGLDISRTCPSMRGELLPRLIPCMGRAEGTEAWLHARFLHWRPGSTAATLPRSPSAFPAPANAVLQGG